MSAIRSYSEAYLHIVGRRPEVEADPERLAAARMAAINSLILKTHGWVCRRWVPFYHRPLAYKAKWGGWDWIERPSWLDHPYRLVNKEKGREIFVAEPYGLSLENFESLNKLEAEGWVIDITAEGALHFPGSTIRVGIEKKT